MPVYNEYDDGSGDSGVMPSNGPSKDSVKKLDQIIQVRIGSFHQDYIVIFEANALLHRISIQKQLSLCCNRECLFPSCTLKMVQRRSINGYV